MKKVLVTGGAGFIGSHLCEFLINNNFVYCLDNLSTGNKHNIKHLENNNNFQFIHHDIIDPINLLVDEIYNFGCPASPVQYQKNPVYTLKTNMLGTLNVLDLAQKNKAKIIQASTSEVYGDPLIHPQPETYFGNVNPCGIRSCYDEGKRVAETLIYDFHRNFNVNVRVIRIFNTYGERMDKFDGRVISNFINQALNNEDITIFGKGEQTRSFQYVSDLISGIDLVMSGDSNEPFNIGNPEEYTIIQLAEKIISMTNSKSKISFSPLPQDDPTKRKPDITKMIKKFNWKPKVNLEVGLNRTIHYFLKKKTEIN